MGTRLGGFDRLTLLRISTTPTAGVVNDSDDAMVGGLRLRGGSRPPVTEVVHNPGGGALTNPGGAGVNLRDTLLRAGGIDAGASLDAVFGSVTGLASGTGGVGGGLVAELALEGRPPGRHPRSGHAVLNGFTAGRNACRLLMISPLLR